jgi:hypothetical protein
MFSNLMLLDLALEVLNFVAQIDIHGDAFVMPIFPLGFVVFA